MYWGLATWPSMGPSSRGKGPAHGRLATWNALIGPGASQKGVAPYIIAEVGLILWNSDFVDFIQLYLEIFGPFWGISGHFLGQILGGSWDMVTNFISI
jgi:hypothetical protein